MQISKMKTFLVTKCPTKKKKLKLKDEKGNSAQVENFLFIYLLGGILSTRQV
jgi:hypothetical protein